MSKSAKYLRLSIINLNKKWENFDSAAEEILTDAKLRVTLTVNWSKRMRTNTEGGPTTVIKMSELDDMRGGLCCPQCGGNIMRPGTIHSNALIKIPVWECVVCDTTEESDFVRYVWRSVLNNGTRHNSFEEGAESILTGGLEDTDK